MENYNKGKRESLGYAFGHSEDTNFKSNTGSHISPEVIHRESANLALAPEKVKEIMKNLRNSGNELDESGKYGYNKLTSRKLGFNFETPVDKIEYGKSAVIDKKKMRIKDSGLPQAVMDQTPKLLRRSKLPIVKAKVGPQILALVADEKIFDQIPVKKEIKAQVSGIYIVGFRGAHGIIRNPEGTKKKSRFRKWVDNMQTRAELYELLKYQGFEERDRSYFG